MSLSTMGASGCDYRYYPVSAQWSRPASTPQSISQSSKKQRMSPTLASPKVPVASTKPPCPDNFPIITETKLDSPLRDESLIISRLKGGINIGGEETFEQRLDGVTLEILPKIEVFLEESYQNVRYDYYAETQSLVITTPSHVHECGVNAVRRIFEPAMEKCTQRYGKVWPYHTNCAFPLFRSDTDGQIPTGDILTPDGAISDGGARLSLVVEVASAQQLKNAREKLQTYFVDPSVKAGIIMNIDESPAYAAPKYYDDWEWDQKCVTYQEWPELEEGTWGPINFFSYCWGGRFTCQMEVHWPGKGNEVEIVKASLIPLGPESDIDDLNMELAAVWSALREPILGNHDSSGSGEDDVEVCMDAGLFQQQLVEELRLTSYNRYAAAFAKFNPKVKTLEAEDKEQKVRDRLFDAAKVRALARDLKRKQLSRDEEVVERFSKVPRVHSDPKS